MGNFCPSRGAEDKYAQHVDREQTESHKMSPSPLVEPEAPRADEESSASSTEPSPLVLHKDLKLNLQHISEREGECFPACVMSLGPYKLVNLTTPMFNVVVTVSQGRPSCAATTVRYSLD
jgi:hypothetical protein